MVQADNFSRELEIIMVRRKEESAEEEEGWRKESLSQKLE